MLQKLVKSNSNNGSGVRTPPLSIIGTDVRIVGDIVSQGEIHIDGVIEGDITCVKLVVGEGARIAGEVTAEVVKVHGELTGKINASQISIARSARVTGDVTHESLEIEAGAHVEGHCLRKATPPAKVEPKRIEAQPEQVAPVPQNGKSGKAAHNQPATANA